MISIKVTWTCTTIQQGSTILYQVQTVCSEPNNIPDAAVLRVTQNDDYESVCPLPDYIFYLPYKAVRRITLENVLNELDETYIGQTVENLGDHTTGILRGFSADKKRLFVEAPNAEFSFPGQLKVYHNTNPLTANYVFTSNDVSYRTMNATRVFGNISEAKQAIEIQKARIKDLLLGWKENYSGFNTVIQETINVE